MTMLVSSVNIPIIVDLYQRKKSIIVVSFVFKKAEIIYVYTRLYRVGREISSFFLDQKQYRVMTPHEECLRVPRMLPLPLHLVIRFAENLRVL